MECSEQQFLEDVKDLRIIILNDYRLNRHLQFRKAETLCFSFDLITWPGHLCYTGDMGTYVFKRLEDMFEFFRTKPNESDGISINLDYWSEKCIAIDHPAVNTGITEYSKDAFHSCITERLDADEVWPELRQTVQDKILKNIPDNEYEAREVINNFAYEGFTFQDFWEANLHEYTYHYTWCCYALVWSIEKYDIIKNKALEILEG